MVEDCNDCGMDSEFGQFSLEVCSPAAADPCCRVENLQDQYGEAFRLPEQKDEFVTAEELGECFHKDLGVSPGK